MANLEGGDFTRFTVIKNKDIENYLDPVRKRQLKDILNNIQRKRMNEDKEPMNTYIVINTDEDYASEVIDILKENRHWG